MANPSFNLVPGNLALNGVVGNDFSVLFDFDIDLTGYTFEAQVILQNIPNNNYGTFLITETNLEEGRITISLTDTQTKNIGAITNTKWYLSWTIGGNTRTVLSGNFSLNNPWAVTNYSPTSEPQIVQIDNTTVEVTVIGGAGGSVVWGDIQGDIENQTDLINYLNEGFLPWSNDIVLVTEGDSITQADGVNCWPVYLSQMPYLNGRVTLHNSAVGGSDIQDAIDRYPTAVYPYRPAATGASRSIFMPLMGANNCPIIDAQATFDLLAEYIQMAVDDGFEVWLCVMLSNYNDNAEADKFRLLIKQYRLPEMILLTDTVLPYYGNSAMFSDGIHPTNQGQECLAGYINNALFAFGSIPNQVSSMAGQSEYDLQLRKGLIHPDVNQAYTHGGVGSLVYYSGGDWVQVAVQDPSNNTYPNGFTGNTIQVWASGPSNSISSVTIDLNPTLAFLTSNIFRAQYSSYSNPAISAVRLRNNNAGDGTWAIDVQIRSGIAVNSTLVFVTKIGTAQVQWARNPDVSTWILRTANLVGSQGLIVAGNVYSTNLPSSSSDNAIVRFDGTGGSLQNSTTTLNDAGVILFPFSNEAKILWIGNDSAGVGWLGGEGLRQWTQTGTTAWTFGVGTYASFTEGLRILGNGTLTSLGPITGSNLSGTNTGDQYGSATSSTPNQYLRRNAANNGYEFGNKTDYLTSIPTSGQAIAFNDNPVDQVFYINPAGDLADLQLILPSDSTSIPTQKVVFCCTHNITTLDLTGATTIFNAPVAMNAGDCFQFYKMASNVWARVIT